MDVQEDLPRIVSGAGAESLRGRYRGQPGPRGTRRRQLVIVVCTLLAVGLLLTGGMALIGRGGRTAATSQGWLVAAGWSGRHAAGVPIGYAHTKQGALSAATNYMIVLGSPLILDPTTRHAAVQAMAAPESQDAVQAALDQAAPQIAEALRLPRDDRDRARLLRAGVIIRNVPIGYRLERYDEHAATVAIWATGVIGSTTGQPPRQAWGTYRITLRWAEGDWKYVDSSTTDGPTPQPSTLSTTPPNELIQQASQFQEYRHAPGPGS